MKMYMLAYRSKSDTKWSLERSSIHENFEYTEAKKTIMKTEYPKWICIVLEIDLQLPAIETEEEIAARLGAF